MPSKSLEKDIDAVVTIPGVVAGLAFEQFDGGDVTADTTANRAPGAQFQTKTAGTPDISDITVTTPWIESAMGPLMSLLDNACSFAEDCTVGKVVRDKHGNRIRIDTYAPCVLTGVAGPKGNTTSNDSATLVLTLAVNGKA
jgi:hypothetical protein